MGRFHRHDDGTVHSHEGGDHHHTHDHDHLHGTGPGQHTHDEQHDFRPGAEHDRLSIPDSAQSHHGDHTAYDTGRERIAVLEDIFTENDVKAANNRKLFDAAGVRCINVMSSPGAGKTTLLERTLAQGQGKVRFGVVEGDIETALDSQRLEAFGAQVSLLNTGNGFGGECHLDAPMVARALEGLNLDELDVVLIENVGNLVCPAEFEVGEHAKAMVASVTEGEDKPLKYPVMFRSVEVCVVNKIDLLPYLDFDMDLFLKNLRQVNPDVKVIPMSTKTGEGVEEWMQWLSSQSGV